MNIGDQWIVTEGEKKLVGGKKDDTTQYRIMYRIISTLQQTDRHLL